MQLLVEPCVQIGWAVLAVPKDKKTSLIELLHEWILSKNNI